MNLYKLSKGKFSLAFQIGRRRAPRGQVSCVERGEERKGKREVEGGEVEEWGVTWWRAGRRRGRGWSIGVWSNVGTHNFAFIFPLPPNISLMFPLLWSSRGLFEAILCRCVPTSKNKTHPVVTLSFQFCWPSVFPSRFLLRPPHRPTDCWRRGSCACDQMSKRSACKSG